MKTVVTVLSLILSVTLAVPNASAQTSSKKSSQKKVSKKQIAKKKVAKKTTQNNINKNALVTRLPKKKTPNIYSGLYPYTASTAASAGSLDMVQQSKVVVETPVVTEEAPKKWYIKFESENAKNITEENPAGYNGDINAVQTLSYGYKFTDMSTVQISQDWTQAYGYGATPEGRENAHSNSYEDLNFRYTYGSLLNTENSNLAGQVRYYAPISQNSQNAGQVGQIRLYAIYDYTISTQWTFEYILSPRYFMQTANAYEKEDGTIVNNNHWRLLNSAGVKFSPSDWFALETTVGVYTKKKYNESTKHFQDYSTSFYLMFGPVSLQTGIRASDGAYDTRDKGGFNFYDADVSEYFSTLSIKI